MPVLQVDSSLSGGFRGKYQPTVRIKLNQHHPLAKNVKTFFTPIGGGEKLRSTADVGYSRTAYGSGFVNTVNNVTTSDLGWETERNYSISQHPQYSVFILHSQDTYNSAPNGKARCLYSERPNGTQIFKIGVEAFSAVTFVTRNSSSGGLINEPVGPVLDTSKLIHTSMFVRRSDTSRDVYADDNKVNVTNNSGGSYDPCIPVLCADPHDDDVPGIDASVHLVITFTKALSDDEWVYLKENPYGLFVPEVQYPYMIPSGVAPSPVSLSLMSHASYGGL